MRELEPKGGQGRPWRWMVELVSDLRYAGRAMAKTPAFALAAIISLALGTGANTTMFSLTMELVFSEPSVKDVASLAILRLGGSSHADQKEYRFLQDAKVYPALAGMREEGGVNWRQGGETIRLHGMRVTNNYFAVTGAPVWLGRGIAPGERDTVVVNHGFWRSRLGAREDIVGRALVLDGRPFTVVGVLPRDHRTLAGLGFTPDLFVPVTDEREPLKLIARLPEGMTRAQALERLRMASGELDKAFPPAGGVPRSTGLAVEGVSAVDRMEGRKFLPLAVFFTMLMVVSGLVLLVACVNVASLNLARGESRRQELSIRLAMGASRGRLVRQLLAESLALAGLGTAGGLLLNGAAARWMNALALPLPVPVRLNIQPDWRLFGYAAAVAVVSALVSGLIPAVAATRGDVQPGLKQGERSVAGGRRKMRSALVIAQLAATTVLLVTGLLFLRNLGRAADTDPGFDVGRTTWVTMRLVPERYAGREPLWAVAGQALESLRQLPGVESTALAEVVPLNDSSNMKTSMKTDLGEEEVRVDVKLNRVSPEYFRTMGIALTNGRDFNESDRDGAPGTVILNERLAQVLFGPRSAVGRTISWEIPGGRKTLVVVGVARNSKYFTLGEENQAAFYTPWLQGGGVNTTLHLMVRSGRPPEELAREIRAAIAGMDPTAAVEVRPMRSALAMAFLPSRVGALLLGSMGALGLLLASLGLYGVLAYAVGRRVREFGLRMALGASPGQVACMVFGQSFLLIGAGTGVGLALAALATQPLTMFLVPGVRPGDAVTYVGVGVLLALVGMAATAGPAWRALRVQPATALRQE